MFELKEHFQYINGQQSMIYAVYVKKRRSRHVTSGLGSELAGAHRGVDGVPPGNRSIAHDSQSAGHRGRAVGGHNGASRSKLPRAGHVSCFSFSLVLVVLDASIACVYRCVYMDVMPLLFSGGGKLCGMCFPTMTLTCGLRLGRSF
jgi:hypothetical protein